MKHIVRVVAASIFVLAMLLSSTEQVSATGNITSVSLSSNKVTPGHQMHFSLHTQPNVRQNVNRSEPVPIPEGWFVEISVNPQYPGGVWGVHRILLPENNIISYDDGTYSFEAPYDPGYYRFRMQTPEGEFFASEVFQVRNEPFVEIYPSRAFGQGETVTLYIYDENGQPWSNSQWGNQQGYHEIDVYTVGNAGFVSYAGLGKQAPVQIESVGNGMYRFAASQQIGEYYVGFNRYSHVSLHSSSYDTVASGNQPPPSPPPVQNDPEELPPPLEPFQDDGPTESNEADGLPPADQGSNDDVPSEADAYETAPRFTPVPTPMPILTPVPIAQPQPEISFDCPLEVGKAYKSRSSSAVYFVTEPRLDNGRIDTTAKQCTKRAFRNSRVFFTYFTSWGEVQVDDRINSIAEDRLRFMPLGRLYNAGEGAVVKVVGDPKVYLLQGGKKYWIRSGSVFESLNYSYDWIEDVSDDLLSQYADGEEIRDASRHPRFTLIKAKGDSRVYRLEPNPQDPSRTQKRHIQSLRVFDRLGYRTDRILEVDDLAQYEEGSGIE
ncbi:hypothetical protein H6758_00485 [Candidatus Nomurabacteria bacterium]|nr:hypothetical protein [Candidatus Nomurabacteria bacterium]